ncbi:hypothetical protein J2T13_001973 [Paenibacillus sp. DS2015]|uniref:hypothetical protein n=1 Tax=Paenibacillus sp. DS2015 TaxID=3373917 RepID=UPI003D23FD48
MAVLILGGCNVISDPIVLMKTPQISADKESLRQFIETQLPEGNKKIRARETEDTSLIRFVDLNNDGVDETVVFYETPDQDVLLHGMIFEKIENGTWIKKLAFDGVGKVLESLKFEDITNDGNIDIIAGYSRGEDLDKALIVYSYLGDSVEKQLELPYTEFIIDDLNMDKINDLTIISLTPSELAVMTTYQYKESFITVDRLELNPNVDNYYNVVSGKVAKDKEGIILDSSIGETSSYSEIIVMENNKLRLVMDQDRTYKELQVTSEDVNNDGIYEIGMLEIPKGWEHFNFDEIPWFFSYYQWDGGEDLVFVRQQYQDLTNHFHLNFFPPEWHNNVTVDTKSVKDDYLRFIMLDTGKTVAEIKFFTLHQWEKDHGDWELLTKDKSKVMGYKSYDDNLKLNKSKERDSTEVPLIERKVIKNE